MVENGLEKVRFYDNWLKGLGGSIILIVAFFLIGAYNENDTWFYLLIFSFIPLVASLAVIFWGMVYHEYHRKDWWWLIATIVIIIVFGVGFLVSIIYYFVVMRKEFRKGKGIYDEEMTSKEKAKIEHYQKHKSEFDKKENEEFMKFIKGICIAVGVLILLFIVSKFLF